MAIRIFICLLFIFVQVRSDCQFNSPDREIKEGSFITYISPISTATDLERIQSTLNQAGFEIALDSFQFSENGNLQSFYVELVSSCTDEPFFFKKTMDFSEEETFPLAVLLIGDSCSCGGFHTTYDYMKNMFDAFFSQFDPQYIVYGWEGSFDKVKDVDWQNQD